MSQLISILISYFYRPAIDIVLQRLVVPSRGGSPDEALITESIPKTAKTLAVLDEALGDQAFFVGDALTLADLFVLPVLTYLKLTPEGPDLLAKTANITRWQAVVEARRSATETVPPLE